MYFVYNIKKQIQISFSSKGTMKSIQQLRDNESISLKIQLLKSQVYPKKRKSPVRSNSLKIIRPKKITTKIIKVATSQQFEQQNNPQQPATSSSLRVLKKTTLQFNTKKNKLTEQVPWTTQNWMPKASGALIKINNKPRIKQDQRLQENFNRIICQSPPPIVQKKYEPRDAQSLLRKNSLFLLNFIKSKQKQSSKLAHVGNVPLILEKIQRNKIPYEVVKTDRQKRQKKFIQNLKTWRVRQQNYFERAQNHPQSLSPQPW